MCIRCLVRDKVCEGLRFDCVSANELYYIVIDFRGPFADSPNCFGVLENVVKWKSRGYDNLMCLEVVLEFSRCHNNCVWYILHFSIDFFGPAEGFRYIIDW